MRTLRGQTEQEPTEHGPTSQEPTEQGQTEQEPPEQVSPEHGAPPQGDAAANTAQESRAVDAVHTRIDSPLGGITVVAREGALVGAYFDDHRRKPDRATFGRRVDTGFEETTRQLDEYFAGERTRFDLTVAPRGDAFQLRVWQLLTEIPYGETRTYGDLARELGDSGLAQAVGAANGRNPLSVIVPCHRVVGADGSLTGYAGGLERKRMLLELEEPADAKASRLF